ncbi:carbohydrate ABC transporter permease [Kibdelosporangium philippinense]|uniref:carbohydrate ABC transporter permease n=1 Tax=Kibdelosporangium philippinense TaxID=211113 RepID=UPI003609BDE3
MAVGEPRRVGYLYALPALLVYAAFLLFPLLHSGWLSLFTWDGLSLGTWAGLSNYAALFAEEGALAAFGHVAVLILFFSVLPVCIGLVLATALHRVRIRGLPFFRTVLFLPQVIAMVVVAVAWQRIFAPDGALNFFLGTQGKAWLGDSSTACWRSELSVPGCRLVSRWCCFSVGSEKSPPTCSTQPDWTAPDRRGVPFGDPAGVAREIGVALTLTVIAALRTFDLVYMMTPLGGPGGSTTVPAYEIYQRAFHTGQVGSAAAIGVVITVLAFW